MMWALGNAAYLWSAESIKSLSVYVFLLHNFFGRAHFFYIRVDGKKLRIGFEHE